MKIGVVSDIHGNSVALAAVLKEMGPRVKELFVLGDIVGYYYHPDEVLAQLQPYTTTMIRGNHEAMLEHARNDSKKSSEIQARYGSGIVEALKRLSPQQVNMLLGLPEKRTVAVAGMTFLLCHGSPKSNDEYVYPDASEEILQKCAEEGVDMVLMGHTHYPLVRTFGTTTLLNPGSVGQPRDKGSVASWAIIDTDARTAELHRTPFDPQSIVREAREKDPQNPYLVDVLLRKRS